MDETRSNDATEFSHPANVSITGYEIMRELHRGGQGIVFEALQKSTHRKVAVKVLLHSSRAAGTARKRFEREIDLIAQLKHPNIITVFDSGTTQQNQPFYVMDYVSGRSLRDYVRDKKLTLEDTLELVVAICDAVHFVHHKGVIHRDLKPSNILIDSHGNPKVLDFGLARQMVSPIDTMVTMSRDVIGTLPYMSPEQARVSPEEIDARTDVYAMGVILYELLTGHYPYPVTGQIVDVLKHIAETAPTPPLRTWDSSTGLTRRTTGSVRAGDCPFDDEMQTIVLKALAKEPERRYQGMDDLARDIRHYLAGERIEARDASIAYIARVKARRLIAVHPIVSFLVVIVLTTLLSQSLGAYLVFEGTPLNRWFEHFATVTMGSQPGPTSGLDRVRLIALTEATDVVACAEREGLEGVVTTRARSLRRLHGRLMERLALSGVRTVVFDLYFPEESPCDADFVRGVTALKDVGVDVICGVKDWGLDEQGRPPMSPAIASVVRWGSLAAGLSDRAPWRLELVMQRGRADPRPSLALAAVYSHRRPGIQRSYTIDPVSESLSVLYWKSDPVIPHVKKWLGEDRFKLSAISIEREEHPKLGSERGDEVGDYILDVPSDDVVSMATREYGTVFSAQVEQLQKWFSGKVVVVADLRPVDDRFGHLDGRTLSGSLAHLTGIEQLLDSVAIRVPRIWEMGGLIIVAAGIGMAVGVMIRERGIKRYGLLTALVVIFVFGSVVAYMTFGRLCGPFVPAFALVVACELAAIVNKVALSHRRP